MSVGTLIDEYMSTYKAFKHNTKYDGTELSNHSKTKSWQRAKCLSSNYQCAIRLQKLEALPDSIRTKDADETKKYDNKHKNGIRIQNIFFLMWTICSYQDLI